MSEDFLNYWNQEVQMAIRFNLNYESNDELVFSPFTNNYVRGVNDHDFVKHLFVADSIIKPQEFVNNIPLRLEKLLSLSDYDFGRVFMYFEDARLTTMDPRRIFTVEPKAIGLNIQGAIRLFNKMLQTLNRIIRRLSITSDIGSKHFFTELTQIATYNFLHSLPKNALDFADNNYYVAGKYHQSYIYDTCLLYFADIIMFLCTLFGDYHREWAESIAYKMNVELSKTLKAESEHVESGASLIINSMSCYDSTNSRYCEAERQPIEILPNKLRRDFTKFYKFVFEKSRLADNSYEITYAELLDNNRMVRIGRPLPLCSISCFPTLTPISLPRSL